LALFKILKGTSDNLWKRNENNELTVPIHEGYCYFTIDTNQMWIDVNDRTRVCLNSKTAEQLGTSTLGNENTPIYLNEGFPAECHRMLPLIAGENYKIEGPLGLTEKVMFDSELPETGFYGQLFFVEDDDIALPPGGSKNQVLTKKSQVDGDADWQTPKITWDINPNDSNTIKPKLLNIEGNAIPVATENNGGILTTSN
jgi:hypothetical protein